MNLPCALVMDSVVNPGFLATVARPSTVVAVGSAVAMAATSFTEVKVVASPELVQK